jgi:hypothetical protein
MVIVNHYLAFQFFGEFYYPFSEVSRGFSIEILLTKVREKRKVVIFSVHEFFRRYVRSPAFSFTETFKRK